MERMHNMLENNINKNVILHSPTHVELTITEKCNHKCAHCYNAWRNSAVNSLGFEDKKINHVINELVENKVTYVTLTGGEPLIEPEILFSIFQLLQNNNIGIGLNTNLSLMTDAIAERLVNEYKWRNTILTSLPGFTKVECDVITQTPGSFDRICRGIEVCNRYSIEVAVNVVIKKSLVKKLYGILPFLKKHKISVVSLTRAIPPVYDCDNEDYNLNQQDINAIVKFMKYLKNHFNVKVTSLCPLPLCALKDITDAQLFSTKCAAGIIACSINGLTGTVSPCAHNEKTYGNIYNEKLSTIWHKMSNWRNGKHLPSECIGCEALPYCGGDCRLINNRIKFKNYILDELCDYAIIKKIQEMQFNIFKSYKYNYKTIIRKEEFGAVVSLGVNEFYVTHPVYQLLRKLQGIQNINKIELEEICEINDVLIEFLNNLLKANIIYED